jgi:hypothetical protein
MSAGVTPFDLVDDVGAYLHALTRGHAPHIGHRFWIPARTTTISGFHPQSSPNETHTLIDFDIQLISFDHLWS